MDHNFSFETRVLACQNCGAPISASLAGGVADCDYCGAENRIVSRAKPFVGITANLENISEQQRLEMLRRQDGVQLEIPAALKPLIHNYSIPDWKLEETLVLWNRMRKRLEEQDDYQTAEQFYLLTILLSNHPTYEQAPLRIRALYESALEVFSLPRHRQSIYCLLARHAIRENDLQAAEKWIEPCNPKATDLMSDSDYRVTRAYIDTYMEDYQSVLDRLGRSHGSVPVFSTLDTLSIILRANALEHEGDLATATNELFMILMAYKAEGKNIISHITRGLGKHGDKICEQSFAAALARQGNVNLQYMTAIAGGGGIAKPFAFIGTLFLLASIGMVIALLSGELDRHAQKGLTVALPTLGIIGVVFSLIGYKFLFSTRRIKRMHTQGINAKAHVLECQSTGWKINGVTQYRAKLNVVSPEGGSYEKTIKFVGQPLAQGAEVNVKIDPQDSNHVIMVPS